jgi:phage-related protein
VYSNLNSQVTSATIINLYELYVDNDTLRWCSYDETVIYKGAEYTPQTIRHSDIGYGTDGSVQDVTLSIGNAERQIQYYIEKYELIGKQVRIIQAYFNVDDTELGDIRNTFIIKAAKVTRAQADFTLSIGFDVFKTTIPCRRIFARFCNHQFKDKYCQYQGADSVCTKIFKDCKGKKNLANFGGFPGARNERLYF